MTGTKYNKELTITEIAKNVRADIKQAIKSHQLPQGTKVSVKVERYSMGQSLNLKVTALPGVTVENDRWVALWNQGEHQRLVYWCSVKGAAVVGRITNEAHMVEQLLKDLANAYNFDKSDSMTDYYHVNFHTHVRFSEELLPIR